jgi:hypothetical protein
VRRRREPGEGERAAGSAFFFLLFFFFSATNTASQHAFLKKACSLDRLAPLLLFKNQ